MGAHLGGELVTWNFTWNPSYIPIQMHYNPSYAPSGTPDSNTIATLAYTAYSLWTDQYSFLTIQNASPFTTSINQVLNGFSVMSWFGFGNSNTLAHSYGYPNDWDSGVFWGPNTNTGVNVRFNYDIGTQSWYFNQVPPSSHTGGQIDFVEILAHELGHGIGLQHVTSNTNSIMYPTYNERTGPVRGQSDGDLAGRVHQHTISSIYLYGGDIPHSLVISALSGRTINLGGNVTIPSGKTFQLESGFGQVNLNGYTMKSTGGSIIDGGTWNPDIKRMSGSTLLGRYPSVQSALADATSGQTVIVPSGTYSFNSNLTVPSGVTLQLNSDVTITYNGYYKLRIEGTLNASYATFQGSGYPGSWFGIEFYNVTSSQNFGSCTIKDATYGLNFINTDVAFYSPTVKDNTYGVNCTNYSDPPFTATLFRTNGFAVYGDASSHPYLGSYMGYNSFRYNDYYDVYSTYPGTIFARGNWWEGGECPPSPLVTDNVDYSSWLCNDPYPSRQPAATDSTGIQLLRTSAGSSSELPLAKAVSSSPEPGMRDLDAAYLLYVDGKYEEALQAFEAVVAGYPDNFAGRRALVFVERTLDKLGRSNEILARLNTASASYSRKALGEFAKARRVYQYLNQGRYQDAVTQAAEVVRLNNDTTLVKFALYDLGSIYWCYIRDTKTGEQYYRQLIARFPKDHLTNSALATLGEWKPEEPSGKPANSSLAQSKEPPTQYNLTQNYPNPFNPSTVISYQLPTGGYVTLKLYNTLGQEVATLVDGIQDAGFKSVTFDASRLPSGVYFYRLQSGAFIQDKKMLFVK
jgi:tetratricopeptide (TPR) repeat protein